MSHANSLVSFVVYKSPSAVLDYAWDWKPFTHGEPDAESDWLTPTETITQFAVSAPAGITVAANPAPSQADGKVTAWLTGGSLGAKYLVTCQITTSAGRVDTRTMEVRMLRR